MPAYNPFTQMILAQVKMQKFAMADNATSKNVAGIKQNLLKVWSVPTLIRTQLQQTCIGSREDASIDAKKTSYGPRDDNTYFDNKALIHVEKYEVEGSSSRFEAELIWLNVGDKNAVRCEAEQSNNVRMCAEDKVESNDLQVDVLEWDCGVCDLDGASAMRKACCESCGNMIEEEGLNQKMRYLICKNCPDFPYPTDYSQIIDKMKSNVEAAIVDMQAGIKPSILTKYPDLKFRGLLRYDVETADRYNNIRTETSNETCITELRGRIPYQNQTTTVHWGGCSSCDESKEASCCRQCSLNTKEGSYLVCHGCDKKELQNGQGYLDDTINQIVKHYSGMVTGKSSSLPIFASFILLLLSFL